MAQRHITKIRCSKEYYQITQIRLSETKKKKKKRKIDCFYQRLEYYIYMTRRKVFLDVERRTELCHLIKEEGANLKYSK